MSQAKSARGRRARPAFHYIGSDASALTTAAEYAVLTALSLCVALALFWAATDLYHTAAEEGERIALKNVAAHVAGAADDLVRCGAEGTVELRLPQQLGGLPYVAEPTPDGAGLRLHLLQGNSPRWVVVALLCPGARLEGHLYSTMGPHRLSYDPAAGRLVLW